MAAKLEHMRQLIKEENDRKNGNRSGGDRTFYPAFNIPEKGTAVVRFLPDQDDNNPWFWIERQTIRLEFSGLIGERVSGEPVSVTVPCMDMYVPRSCPIIAATRQWWNTDEKLARKYWKRRSFIAQGFVVSSPFEEPDAPDNPIRLFRFGTKLIDKLKAGLMDDEMEDSPFDYLKGTDFKIKRTKQGEFNNYDTSEWSRRSRPLSESEHMAIERFGLFNLKDFLGTRPDNDGVEIIKSMFHDSIDGKPFDMAAYGNYYKPYGMGQSAPTTSDEMDDFATPRSNAGNGTRPVQESPPVETTPEPEGGTPSEDNMADILAKLKAKNAAAVQRS